MTFKVGDKVRYDYEECVGKILEVKDTDPAEYKIDWGYSHRAPEWEDIKNLVLVDEEADRALAAQLQSKINEATSAMEEAWQAFSAAREEAYKRSSLAAMSESGLVNLKDFERTAERFGWSSSSLHC